MMIPHLKVNSSIRFNKKLLLNVTKTISINKAVAGKKTYTISRNLKQGKHAVEVTRFYEQTNTSAHFHSTF